LEIIMHLTKRDLLAGAAVTLAAPLIVKSSALAQTSPAPAVTAGLTYFQDRAALQIQLCKDLTAALKTGNFALAEAAYAASRPPYEEIEVHAGAFADIDTAIDARPYAFEGGEANDGFRGFHRVETLLFRDRDLATAAIASEDLENSVKALAQALSEPDRFSPELFFEGLIALPEEVASKKISSEEETWSDLSLVIFRHNFIGVQSQFAGFTPDLSDKAIERATLAFMRAEALLEPYFEGQGVTAYSDVRRAERRAIAQAATDIRDAMEAAGAELSLI
jgi:iron uptake system component EfeO